LSCSSVDKDIIFEFAGACEGLKAARAIGFVLWRIARNMRLRTHALAWLKMLQVPTSSALSVINTLIFSLCLTLAFAPTGMAEDLSPPTLNGGLATGGTTTGNGTCTSPNLGGTLAGGAATGTFNNHGANGPVSFNLTAKVIAPSGSNAQWVQGVCFPSTQTIRFQVANTSTTQAGSIGFGEYEFQFSAGVKSLGFTIQGVDNGDNVDIFAYNGATQVPVNATNTTGTGTLTTSNPPANRLAGGATDANAIRYQAPASSPTETVTVNFPIGTTITRIVLRYGKDGASTQNATTLFSAFNWDVETAVRVTKNSIGGVGPFTFNGNNGFGTAETITTVTAGTPVQGINHIVTNAETVTTITETIPPGYTLTSVNCTGFASGTATPNLAAGSVTLNALAMTRGNNVACTFTNTSTVASHSISKTQTSGPNPITAAGQTIGYTINVANTGGVALTTPVLTDALTQGATALTLTSGPTLTAGDINTNGTIDVGETWSYAATYQSTLANLNSGVNLSNVATIDTAQTTPLASAPVVTPITQNPRLTMLKTATPSGPYSVGQTVTYNFLITNTGNVTISGVTAYEAAFNGTGGTGAITPVVTPAGASTTLPPGGTVNFTATYVVTQADIDTLQ
jgi:uncharacterized repeat protein (TIGR01451 family)